MIRPHYFGPNPMTARDNAFQATDARQPSAIAKAAFEEVTRMAEGLARAGVAVHLFEDETAALPDSVFPNNWFSTHSGGHVAIYPMYSESRQSERRPDIIEMLKSEYRVQDVIDYSGLEKDGVYLEGTGAMVLDHIGRVAYAARDEADAKRCIALIHDYYKRFDNVFSGPGSVRNGLIEALPRKQTIEELTRNVLVCPPGELVDRLGAYEEAGIDEVILSGGFGQSQAEMLEMMHRFALDVAPHFARSGLTAVA